MQHLLVYRQYNIELFLPYVRMLVYEWMYVCMYVCVYVCMYVCILDNVCFRGGIHTCTDTHSPHIYRRTGNCRGQQIFAVFAVVVEPRN